MELLASLFVGEAEDEHVLSHPGVTASHGGSDTESEALLTKECVAAVTGTEGPNFVGFWEVGDVLFIVAWPRGIFLAFFKR